MISNIQKIMGKDGKVKEIEFRSVTNRKLQRQAIKNKQGNNRIRHAWHQHQGKA